MSWDEDTSDSADSLLRGVAAAPDVDPAWFAAVHLVPGAMLTERLRVVRRIGAGGMGVVWLAYHLELERLLAVKLHPFDDERGPDRLLREARAVAAISHPNVVVIHDVGRLAAGLVFVAMEYVEGGTLRSWSRAAARPWPEVVDMFVQAARGLAAAHAAGLVHGDVKPDNLLVGSDGRVRVADFGLARFALRELDHAPGTDARVLGDGPVTRGSRIGMGTPAYMAPEQILGAPASPASDQFALCVSLWEALFGARPFAGTGVVAPTPAVTRSDKAGRIPARLRRVLLRGLAEQPRARHVDMRALELALERCRRPARAALRVLGVVAVAPALVVGAAVLAGDHDACASAAQRAEQLLPESRRSGLAAAMAERDDAAEIDRSLVQYAERWGELAAASCRELREPVPEPDVEHRRTCLDDVARDLDVLLDVLSVPDAAVATTVPLALAQLRAPEQCIAERGLAASRWRPLDDDVARSISRATLLQNLARYDEAERELRPWLDDPGLDPAARNEVLTQLGTTAEARGDLVVAARELSEAFEVALAAGDDYRAVSTGVRLTHLFAADIERIDQAESWWRRTEALALGLELEPGWQADLAAVHASLLVHRGRYRDAEREYGRAIEILDAAGEVGRSFGLGFALAGRARALDELGDDAAAMVWYEHALAFEEDSALAGPMHGTTAAVLNNMAACAYDLGRYQDSVAYYERAIEIASVVLGPEHPHTATFLGNLANSLVELGRPQEALAAMLRANAILRRRLGEHVAVAYSEHDLASLLHRLGRDDDARLHALDSVELSRRLLGEGPDLAVALGLLAEIERARGDRVAARRALAEAIAIWTSIAEQDPEAARPGQELAGLAALDRELRDHSSG